LIRNLIKENPCFVDFFAKMTPCEIIGTLKTIIKEAIQQKLSNNSYNYPSPVNNDTSQVSITNTHNKSQLTIKKKQNFEPT